MFLYASLDHPINLSPYPSIPSSHLWPAAAAATAGTAAATAATAGMTATAADYTTLLEKELARQQAPLAVVHPLIDWIQSSEN